MESKLRRLIEHTVEYARSYRSQWLELNESYGFISDVGDRLKIIQGEMDSLNVVLPEVSLGTEGCFYTTAKYLAGPENVKVIFESRVPQDIVKRGETEEYRIKSQTQFESLKESEGVIGAGVIMEYPVAAVRIMGKSHVKISDIRPLLQVPAQGMMYTLVMGFFEYNPDPLDATLKIDDLFGEKGLELIETQSQTPEKSKSHRISIE
jgi:hypothetical protein